MNLKKTMNPLRVHVLSILFLCTVFSPLLGFGCGRQKTFGYGSFLFRADTLDREVVLDLGDQSFTSCSAEYIAQRTKNITLHTPDGVDVPVLFIDNNSPYVLILGQGFRANKEGMACFMRAFGHDYDIVAFDYRWAKKMSYMYSMKTLANPVDRLVYHPLQEVLTVVDYVRSLNRNYKEIACLGECYSAFMFVMAQAHAIAHGKQLFTRMILDSCWPSFDAFNESLNINPCGYSFPQRPSKIRYLRTMLQFFHVHKFFGVALDTVASQVKIDSFLQTIKEVPILFVHGNNDLMVLPHHFEQLWAMSSSTRRAAFFTPYGHVNNFHNKSLYKGIVDTFIQNSFNDFVQKVAGTRKC